MSLHSGFVALQKVIQGIVACWRVVSADEATLVVMCGQLEPLVFAGDTRERNDLPTCKGAVLAATEQKVLDEWNYVYCHPFQVP